MCPLDEFKNRYRRVAYLHTGEHAGHQDVLTAEELQEVTFAVSRDGIGGVHAHEESHVANGCQVVGVHEPAGQPFERGPVGRATALRNRIPQQVHVDVDALCVCAEAIFRGYERHR